MKWISMKPLTDTRQNIKKYWMVRLTIYLKSEWKEYLGEQRYNLHTDDLISSSISIHCYIIAVPHYPFTANVKTLGHAAWRIWKNFGTNKYSKITNIQKDLGLQQEVVALHSIFGEWIMNYQPKSHERSNFLLWLEMWCRKELSNRVKLVLNP